MKKKIILIGGGGHCKSCIDVIEQADIYNIAGIIEVPEKAQLRILGYSVIGTDNDLSRLIKTYPNVLITIGHIKSPARRIQLYNDLKTLGASFPIIKSPLSYVSRNTNIGEGTIIMHNALINAGATVGKNCIINTSALIEHDAFVEDHCHISTNAVINGGAQIGNGSFVGSGAVIKEYISVSANSFIKANSLKY